MTDIKINNNKTADNQSLKQSTEGNFLTNLPLELALLILSNLDGRALSHTELVSKDWHYLSNDPILLKGLIESGVLSNLHPEFHEEIMQR